MSLKFEYVGNSDEGAALSDRLVVLLGPDLVLAVGATIAKSGAGAGLAAGVQRLQQAATELTEAKQVAAVTEAEKKAARAPTLAAVVQIMESVAGVDPAQLLADSLARAFGPAMTQWKADVLSLVEIDGQPAREVRLTAGQRNAIVWEVANAAGFFPWPAG